MNDILGDIKKINSDQKELGVDNKDDQIDQGIKKILSQLSNPN